MNPEIKKRWVAALRSGEYEQGKGRLVTEDGKFCCLGVLCDLAVGDGVVTHAGEGFTSGGPEGIRIGSLPDAVVGWAGVKEPNPYLPQGGPTGRIYLADLNDGAVDNRQHPFSEIADLIEQHL